MKRIIKQITPGFIINAWHYLNAWYGAVRFDHPSEELMVIGVTGTSGKSSTIHFLRQVLESLGFVVGSLSTADFYIDGEVKLNDRKMTMLGKGQIHKYLRDMRTKGCDIAILETTSEGALQHRHKFINYDYVVFTNLYPEHIEAHGSFENYKNCKLDILRYVSKCKHKYKAESKDGWSFYPNDISGKDTEKIEKTCFLNGNNEHMPDAAEIDFDQIYVFARNDQQLFLNQEDEEVDRAFISKDNEMTKEGLSFNLDGRSYQTKILGKHNIWNILASIAVANKIKPEAELEQAVQKLSSPPGRLEFIPEAEKHGFQVIVDYAFEPKALRALYETVEILDADKIIHVCGSAGGGRDKSRRGPIGRIAAQNADEVIVTNEDPYYEDPQKIIDQVAAGAEESGEIKDEHIHKILDREEAIKRAVEMAEDNDLVLITGKGSEQGIMQDGEMIPWDDREIVRDKL
ncbi:MAG: Mur ligase family protein [Candidatus Paceibacteria bacterium]